MLKPARVLNVVETLLLESTPTEKRRGLEDELGGRFRTFGLTPLPPDEENAPAWWHGKEEAYEAFARGGAAPRRRISRRR
jgi:hypothetical protein